MQYHRQTYGHTRFLAVQTGVVEDECVQCDNCQTGARKMLEEHITKVLSALVFSYVHVL
jgi:hypothetical protein